MPVIYKNNLSSIKPCIKLPKDCVPKCRAYHYKESSEVVGDGIFSGISSLVSPAIKLVSANKDIIANAAKGAAAIGGLAAVANQIAQANKELTQIESIKKLREAAELAASIKPQTRISDEAKRRVEELSISRGDGIMKF